MTGASPSSLRVGRIPFLVCAPYFHASLSGFPGVTFIDGPPRALNVLLAGDHVDCSPSSSFEYARHASQYLLLPGLCTSGRGEVKSVLLFSREPWEKLAGRVIELSPHSDTSNALVRVMSRFRFGVEPVFRESVAGTGLDSGAEPDAGIDARIAIGDAALRESAQKKWPHRYDLAQVWQAWQGEPLPLGIWILRAKAWENDPARVREYYRHLKNSLRMFSQDPEGRLRIWERAYGLPMPLSEALEFFSTADYHLTSGHEKSLRMFFDLCARAGLLPAAPELRFADI